MDEAANDGEAVRLEGEVAEVCGLLNAATGRLVALIARVLAAGAWQGGIRSAEHWVAWKCGVSRGRARSLVAMARRRPALPETMSALEAGGLSEDQVAVVCRHAPATIDAEVATLARSASVTQLQRVLGRYAPAEPAPDESDPEVPEPKPEEPRRVSFGFDDEGSWRLSALLPADEGALWERALAEAREALFRSRAPDAAEASAADVSWADALVAVAEGFLASSAEQRPHRDRHLVLLDVNTEPGGDANGHLHLGPGRPPGCAVTWAATPASARCSRPGESR